MIDARFGSRPKMATNSIKQLQTLILWARKEKIVLSHVQLGNLTVQIERDHGLSLPSGPPQAVERKQSIYEQYAGAILQDVQPVPTEQVNEPTVEDDE